MGAGEGGQPVMGKPLSIDLRVRALAGTHTASTALRAPPLCG